MGFPSPPVPEFDVVLRGYDRTQVTDAVTRAHAAVSGDSSAPHIGAAELAALNFDVVLRGYDRTQVGWYVDNLLTELRVAEGGDPAPPSSAPPPPEFDLLLRGYDRTQVADAVTRAFATLNGDSSAPHIGAAELAALNFDVVLRGYDRTQVGSYIDDLVARLRAAEERTAR
ncbi:DivIVA domain-containing protein [Nocardiopsis algeriensis]|uniref:DivIVA domain-containing protein n=1 Tax=Nocardiopsis algeriensis TaxID=1478215 RepID=UPI003B43720F